MGDCWGDVEAEQATMPTSCMQVQHATIVDELVVRMSADLTTAKTRAPRLPVTPVSSHTVYIYTFIHIYECIFE
jgi:hypothetical protein